MASQYVSLATNATTIPQSSEVLAGDIVYIINDDTTNTLYVSFYGDSAENYIPIKAGEKLVDWPTGFSVGTLWYKTLTSTVAFRFLGNKTM